MYVCKIKRLLPDESCSYKRYVKIEQKVGNNDTLFISIIFIDRDAITISNSISF